MKIRFAAIAVVGVLFGLAGCGSEAKDSASSVSAHGPTTTTSTAPSTTSTAASVAQPAATSSGGAAPVSAAAADAPAAGRLMPSTVPTQTLTTLPSDSFTVTYQGASYYCEPHSYSDKRNDCVRYYGGAAPYVGRAELYCSYSARPECSKLWYPADLDDADMVTIGGQAYVCKSALFGGSYGDKGCARYSGGDPDRVSYFMALKCSSDLGTLQCDDDYYPSEMEGLTQVRISYQDYLCKSSYGGKQCWKWSSYQSPKQATTGMPDLYCNSSGTCAEDGYPSGY